MTEPAERDRTTVPASPTPPAIPPNTARAAVPPLSAAGFASDSDRTWALVAHFGATALVVLTAGVLAWLPGVFVVLLKGRSRVVRAHGTESANFQATWAIAAGTNLFLGWCTGLMCFSVVFYAFAAVAATFAFVMSIVGGTRASNGLVYRYPLSFRLFR